MYWAPFAPSVGWLLGLDEREGETCGDSMRRGTSNVIAECTCRNSRGISGTGGRWTGESPGRGKGSLKNG